MRERDGELALAEAELENARKEYDRAREEEARAGNGPSGKVDDAIQKLGAALKTVGRLKREQKYAESREQNHD